MSLRRTCFGNRALRWIALAGLSAPLLPAQIAGPITGFVFEAPQGVLRPVLGIPGAAALGSPQEVGLLLERAWVAPRQDAVAAVASDNSLHLFRLGSGAVSEMPLPSLGVPETVVFSPSGAAAALYSGSQVQILKGLSDAPVLAATIGTGTVAQTHPAPSGRIRPFRIPRVPLAVSDDGLLLLAGVGGAIRLYDSSGGSRSLMDAGSAALVAFSPGGHDAAVADPEGAGVVLIRDLNGAEDRQVLTAPDASVSSPTGLAFSADGARLFVADSTTQSVTAFELADGGRSQVVCGCTPVELVRMGNYFRLNEPGVAPLWLLDPGTAALRIVFVPAAGAL